MNANTTNLLVSRISGVLGGPLSIRDFHLWAF